MKERKLSTKEEKAFLDKYDASSYEHPSVTTDIVIFTLDPSDELNILLIKRGEHPYKDCWAIPGGFLRSGKESLDEAAARELKTETNIDNVYLKQLYTFGAPDRDPRTTVISVAYTALVPKDQLDIHAGDDAKDAKLFKIKYDVNGIIFYNDEVTITEADLAFDHSEIVKMAITRLRNRIDYEDDAFNLLRDKNEFTISELKRIHETIKNKSLDLPNFRKTFLRDYVSSGKVVDIEKTVISKGKPARLYKLIEE
ncbi:8-oxo-dGTP diphosphatase [Ruminococcaceae bacterium KH2T8]|nr:8-oxo-dGTP diphosphatase [Ruminococcaceae bacterium KH2T8]